MSVERNHMSVYSAYLLLCASPFSTLLSIKTYILRLAILSKDHLVPG